MSSWWSWKSNLMRSILIWFTWFYCLLHNCISRSCPFWEWDPHHNFHTYRLTSIGSSIWFQTLIFILCGLGQCLREKNDMELKLLNSSALPDHHAPTDDQKLIKLLQEELRNYVSIYQIYISLMVDGLCHVDILWKFVKCFYQYILARNPVISGWKISCQVIIVIPIRYITILDPWYMFISREDVYCPIGSRSCRGVQICYLYVGSSILAQLGHVFSPIRNF